jgi:hypothetical protein
MDKLILGKSPEVEVGTSPTYYRAGNTGLFISKPGANVLSCSDGDLLFDSTANDFMQVLAKGVETILPEAYTIPSKTIIKTGIPIPYLDEKATVLVRWSILIPSSNIHPTAYSTSWDTSISQRYITLPPGLSQIGDLEDPTEDRPGNPVTARTVGADRDIRILDNNVIALQGGKEDADDGKLIDFSSLVFNPVDSTKLAFIARENGGPAPFSQDPMNIYVATFNPSTKIISGATQIVAGARIFGIRDEIKDSLDWSPDGSKLLFVRANTADPRDDFPSIFRRNMWTVDPNGTNLTVVTGSWNPNRYNTTPISDGLTAGGYVDVTSARWGADWEIWFDRYDPGFAIRWRPDRLLGAIAYVGTFDPASGTLSETGDGVYAGDFHVRVPELIKESQMWSADAFGLNFYDDRKKVIFLARTIWPESSLPSRICTGDYNKVTKEITNIQTLSKSGDSYYIPLGVTINPAEGNFYIQSTVGPVWPPPVGGGYWWPGNFSKKVEIIDVGDSYTERVLYADTDIGLDGLAGTLYNSFSTDYGKRIISSTGSHLIYPVAHPGMAFDRAHWIQAADITTETQKDIDIIFTNTSNQSYVAAWTLFKAKGT